MTAEALATPVTASPAMSLAESGFVPDRLIRMGIRSLLRQRLRDIEAADTAAAAARLNEFVQQMNISEIAPLPERANEQHYEVPADFYALVLGAHRKYSACYWDRDTDDLEQAEANALRITCERAGIVDGMAVLDLGCGWGSLSLWIAQQYPRCQVTSVSNSNSQRLYIEAAARHHGLDNVTVLTRDMNDFEAPDRYDRIVSVEMFEHMRNYRVLFEKISRWLLPDGRFFMHIFTHRNSPYPFEDQGPGDWMSRHFFSGGMMPSTDLPSRFQQHLHLERQWRWDGRHYEKTSNAWLQRMDAQSGAVRELFRHVYGPGQTRMWVMRWRMFFMACAELFGYNDGQEWFVSHYRFARQADGSAS